MFQISLDLLEEPAGHAGRYSLPLLPRSDSLHVHPEELTENWLTDPQRRTHILDIFGLEGAGGQFEPNFTDRVLLLDRHPGLERVTEPLERRNDLGPLRGKLPWPLIRLSAA